jgi:hypothetical protein
MELFLIGGHWPKILPQTSKRASLVCTLYVYNVQYVKCVWCAVLFPPPPLWLKLVPGWPATSVSTVVDNSKVWGI